MLQRCRVTLMNKKDALFRGVSWSIYIIFLEVYDPLLCQCVILECVCVNSLQPLTQQDSAWL